MDVTEALVNCYTEPDMVHKTMEKATEFLIQYCLAYKATGAGGIVMAEPLTGLLSPDMDAVQDDEFIIIYHNCGNNTVLMSDSILRTGCAAYHFGNSIDIHDMLVKVPKDIVVMGNVDPAGQFRGGTPESIKAETKRIMGECCAEFPNFVISSGCDIPPASPWENIDAFFEAVEEFYNEA